jgi:phage shock protein PspC (stress-responsive transcriptional regulator)
MIYMSLILILLLVGPTIASIAITRSLSIRRHLVLVGICIFYGIFPLLVTWGGMGLADRFSCQGEATIFHCPAPSWHGNLVTGMFFAHWLAIVTIPSAVLGAIRLLMSLILKVKRSRKTENILESPAAAFYRSRRQKVIAGICSAIAQRWHLPIQGVRVVTLVLAIVLPGFIFLYFWCWLAFPIEPRSQQPVGAQS